MNAALFLIILSLIVVVIWFVFDDNSIIFGICILMTVFIVISSLPLWVEPTYVTVAEQLKLNLKSKPTNEDIKAQTELIIKDSLKSDVYDFVIDIEDNNVNNLLVKKVHIKMKRIVLFKKLYLYDKKTFSILINTNKNKNNIEITELR